MRPIIWGMRYFIAVALLAATPAIADTCPPAPDHAAALAERLALLKDSASPAEAQQISDMLWQLWTDAPDAKAQALLDEGMRQRSGFDLAGARETLDELVAYCPDYAEGYNQRAFAHYLAQDFAAALVDLDRALEIMPEHIGALSGKGLTLMGLGRDEEAQDALKAAVALNPWLNERALIKEPEGTDI
ncbi:TPR repeat-containing protein [Cognatiyoonia koreensis]|uniref:TPR repeat-containing protein n=1 Tax=Cognatiyoonia koreensis TaxID=364200 RepID=A0A1I0QF69_9RHOB|nr:tetratricopeptide repeat protein [Cognatiyoonia koreensis]SEW25660.1 TPR repeat-containing protein [Cognatiyoonia koreensis]